MNESTNGGLSCARSGNELEQLGEVAVRKAHDRVGAAVVDGHAVGVLVDERRAGEDDVRHVADLFVDGVRGEEEVAAARDDLPRLVEIEERGAHRVDEAVAGREDAVVQHEPALGVSIGVGPAPIFVASQESGTGDMTCR